MVAHSLSPHGTITTDWLPHRYDAAQDAVHFVAVDRSMRGTMPFLTDEYLPADGEKQVLRMRDALARAGSPAPLYFIFHSAFCCSTLFAAALDRPGSATSLSEPQILNDVVGCRQRGMEPRRVGEVLDHSLRLLARPFMAGEAVIVKPSNVVNGLAPAILSMRPDARAILLHAPLRLFLASIAKKGLDGRLWARKLFLGLRTDGLAQRLGFDDASFFGQTDLQIAAGAWLAQQALFADMIRTLPDARIRSLVSETLLSRPEQALEAAAGHFGLALQPADIAAAIDGPFKRNSKSGAAFGAEDRRKDYASAAEAHADEIDKVATWAEAVAKASGIPLDLDAALI